jgi:hypothetical protein
MKQINISSKAINYIKSLANNEMELHKEDNDYMTISPLAMRILHNDGVVPTNANVNIYLDITKWMVRAGYLRVQIEPYRIRITDKFNRMVDNNLEIIDGIEYEVRNA